MIDNEKNNLLRKNITNLESKFAELDRIPFYKKVVMADPKKVVAHAIKEAAFGKEVSVYGKLMQAFKTSSKFLPQKMVCNIISKGR